MLRQINFFKVSRVPKQFAGIFKVSNALTNLWHNMMVDLGKAGVKKATAEP